MEKPIQKKNIILLKRLKVRSHKQHRTIAHGPAPVKPAADDLAISETGLSGCNRQPGPGVYLWTAGDAGHTHSTTRAVWHHRSQLRTGSNTVVHADFHYWDAGQVRC